MKIIMTNYTYDFIHELENVVALEKYLKYFKEDYKVWSVAVVLYETSWEPQFWRVDKINADWTCNLSKLKMWLVSPTWAIPKDELEWSTAVWKINWNRLSSQLDNWNSAILRKYIWLPIYCSSYNFSWYEDLDKDY